MENTNNPTPETTTETTEQPKQPKFHKLENWTWEKTPRTSETFPILKTEPKLRPMKNRTSSDWITKLTWEITGTHTKHSQENLEILRNHFNKTLKLIGTKHELKQTTSSLGNGTFRTLHLEIKINFKTEQKKDTIIKLFSDKLKD
jgi:hypothetical protein